MNNTHTNKYTLLYTLVAIALVISGCTPTTQSQQPIIATTLFPIYDFTRIISASTNTSVIWLLPPGAEPHTYELKPSDIGKLTQASHLFYIGETFEPWAHSVIEDTLSPNQQAIAITQIPGLYLGSHEDEHEHETVSCEYSAVYTLNAGNYTLTFSQVDGSYAEDHMVIGIIPTQSPNELDAQLSTSNQTIVDGQSFEPSNNTVNIEFAQEKPVTTLTLIIKTTGTYGFCTEHLPTEFGNTFLTTSTQQVVSPTSVAQTEEGHHHHDESYDPHVWLSIANAKIIVQYIASTLSESYPHNAQIYQKNAQSYLTQLEQLQAEFIQATANCSTQTVISAGHDAYFYLEDAYNLTFETAFGISPDSEPTPRRIAQLYDIATEHNVTHIVFESIVSPTVATTLAKELSIQTAQLHPLDSVSKEAYAANATYISQMRQNAQTLKLILGCK
jgi:ABC-type Zn uptake system ZnuABC Zn-binding protein ZnuA